MDSLRTEYNPKQTLTLGPTILEGDGVVAPWYKSLLEGFINWPGWYYLIFAICIVLQSLAIGFLFYWIKCM